MGKGDHVFNNVVAKLTKTFQEGFAECLRATRKSLGGVDRERLARDIGYRDSWMKSNMPRTWAALNHFKHHPDLTLLRERLQTSVYLGNDVNTQTYSEAAESFEDAAMSFFRKLALGQSPVDANTLLPDVNAVRRAFFHMTGAAEDPGAAARLLGEHNRHPRDLSVVEADIAQVRESLRWAWGRCEHLFRMAAQEFLSL